MMTWYSSFSEDYNAIYDENVSQKVARSFSDPNNSLKPNLKKNGCVNLWTFLKYMSNCDHTVT